MAVSFNTGVPLAGGTVNSPGSEQQDENTYFGALSTNTLSHLLTVHESPVLIRAFGLTDISFVQVVMVTKTKTGEMQQDMQINGRFVALGGLEAGGNNALLLDLPGNYRLRINAEDLGTLIVVGQTTAMSYWSWGLAAYANAIDQTNNASNPSDH